MSYEIRDDYKLEILDTDILYFRDLVDWGADLIKSANEIDKWERSVEQNREGDIKQTNKRTSDQIMLIGDQHEALRPYEAAMFNAVSTAINAYVAYNEYMVLGTDEGYSLLRYNVGDYYGEHADCSTVDGGRLRVVSAILYLNDDYEGGGLVFPRQDVEVKPDAGSMILFPSFGTHPHEALPVTKGTKYAVVTWLR